MADAKQGSDRTDQGKFRIGASGNPKGRPHNDSKNTTGGAALAGFASVLMSHMDGWANAGTGLGISGRDKSINTTFELDVVSADDGLLMWRGDPLAGIIVEHRPTSCVRQGIELCVGDDVEPDRYTPPEADKAETPGAKIGGKSAAPKAGAKPKAKKLDATTGVTVTKLATRARGKGRLDAADAKPLQERISKLLGSNGLDALEKIRLAMCHERAGGGACILIGANDFSTDLRTPLDLKKVRSLEWLTLLETAEAVPLYYYNDPHKPKFGKVAIYQLVPHVRGAGIDGYTPRVTQIHESRLLVFPGTQVSRRMAGYSSNPGWGDSVFTRIVRALRGFNVGYQSAEVLLSDFAQPVYKIKGLAELVSRNPNALTDSMMSVEIGRSICRAVVIDSEEEFSRQSTTLTGYPELMGRQSVLLAAAAGMPYSLIMGESPSGLNATGASDVRTYYDSCAGEQQARVAPAYMRLVEIALAAMGEDPETVNHSVKFPPLWQSTEKEQAETRKLTAETDAIYINADVYSPEECALARFGGDAWSMEMRIDFEARHAQEAIVAPTVSAKPEPTFEPGVDPNDPDAEGDFE